MYISKFQVFNYKAFQDSGVLEFKLGINIIAGQNNAGKTALFEALQLLFPNEPHRSIKTLPNPSSKINSISKVRLELTLSKKEFRAFLESNAEEITIPQPSDDNLKPELAVSLFRQWLNEPEDVEFSLLIPHVNGDIINIDNPPISCLNFGMYTPRDLDASNLYPLFAMIQENNSYFRYKYALFGGINETITYKIFTFFKNRIYRFHAERLNVGSCSFGSNEELLPNAANLAEVIGVLQGRNPARFERFNQYVSVIFPQIKRIALKPKSSQVEIMVWSVDPTTERDDLSFPLSSCGTGIGQVLAILYVVLTSQDARTIIIDEPQSFLHPGAAKKLVEILREFPQHQYFIATHSPTIIAAANPSIVVMLRYEDCQSVPFVMNSQDTKELRLLLDEVGVRLSDVFGMDNILWVEGPTEERCFPLILEKVVKKTLRGTTILAVKNTGDLVGKRAHIANVMFELYDRLSGGQTIFPPAIGFVLDREGLSEQDIDDIKRRSRNPVIFLPRRMYENYLLHPGAIAAVANEQTGFREQPLTCQEVQKWLEQKKEDKCYLPKVNNREPFSDSTWVCNIDGAKLLHDFFAEFSEGRVPFSKTKHSFEITTWLVEQEPNQLSELVTLLQNVLGES